METEESTIDLQKPPKKEQVYFWNKISFDTIQKAIMVLAMILACLPVFVSLTASVWCRIVDIPRFSSRLVGAYWFLLLSILGSFIIACLILGSLTLCEGCTISSFMSKKKALSHWLGLNLLLLLVWSILSFAATSNKHLSFWGDIYHREGLLIFFFYAAFFLVGSWLSTNQMKKVAEAIVITGALTSAMALIKSSIVCLPFYVASGQQSVFENRNHYGYFLAICCSMVIGLILQDDHKSIILKLGRWMEAWFLFDALLFCETRGSFLAVVVVLICWNVYIFMLQKERRIKLLILDGFFLSVLFFFNTGTSIIDRLTLIGKDLYGVYSSENKVEAFDYIGSSRGVLWRHGIRFALQKPLLGYGPGTLIEPYTAVNSSSFTPHNDLILIAASMGFPALIFYLSGLTAHLIGFFRYVKKMSVFEVNMYAVVAAYLISSFFGLSMYYTTPYYFLMLGFSYGVYKMHVKEAADVKLAAETGKTEN